MEMSEHKEAEKIAAMEAAEMGTWRRQSGRFLFSKQACTLLGVALREFSTDEFLALVHAKDRAAMDGSLRDRLDAGLMHDLDFHLANGGKWRRMRGRGNSDRADGVLLDIGDR